VVEPDVAAAFLVLVQNVLTSSCRVAGNTRFAAAGHQVMLSNSRGPDTLTAVVASIQGDVRAGTVAEAARRLQPGRR
jgi:hypothetical protein